jgi:hypothetical protein
MLIFQTHGLHLGAVCQYEGYFFVCHLKGNSCNQIKKLPDSQVTRTKVANAVVCTQNISVFCDDTNDSPEVRELWKFATDSVLDHEANDLIKIN